MKWRLDLTIASVDPSTDHTVMSPFWILSTLEGESWKLSTASPMELKTLNLGAPAAAAAAELGGEELRGVSLVLEERIDPAVARVLRGRGLWKEARGFGKLRRDPRSRAELVNSEEEAAPVIAKRDDAASRA